MDQVSAGKMTVKPLSSEPQEEPSVHKEVVINVPSSSTMKTTSSNIDDQTLSGKHLTTFENKNEVS